MTEPTLLPCPFCGGEAIIQTYKLDHLICSKCRIEPYHTTYGLKDAVDKWNTRTPTPPVWQPIETAPKDGEEILLRIEDDTLGKSVLMARWACGVNATGEDTEGEEDWRDLYANLIVDPLDKHRRRITGWQPLPTP